MNREADMVERLRAIVEELDEWALDDLQQAVASGATGRPPTDKVLTQARRAVEKAARLLEGLA